MIIYYDLISLNINCSIIIMFYVITIYYLYFIVWWLDYISSISKKFLLSYPFLLFIVNQFSFWIIFINNTHLSTIYTINKIIFSNNTFL